MPAARTALLPAALTDPGLRGVVRVLGGPGTGKSRALVEIAAAQIAAGVDPESVLLLTGSARIGMTARAALTSALLGARSAASCRAAVREPLVRTVHSYAFAVLRLAARRNGGAPPRLITGAEQDATIRELLAGDFEDGGIEDGDEAAVAWPQQLRPALETAAFATQLRDLLARCAERGVDPVALQRIGRRCARPEWVAAGQFAQRYEQIMLLRASVGMAAPQATVPALGAAELVGAALEAFAADADLLAAERARRTILLIDDAQHLDPQAALLIRELAAGAELTVIAGDPNQAVFGFRGADAGLLSSGEGPVAILRRSHRCAPEVARVVSAIAGRLPGAAAGRHIEGSGQRPGVVAVARAASTHAESALIADALRRAHLIDGVPWSEMAVIVRSGARTAAGLSRALAAAGVPVVLPPAYGALGEQPAVRALVTVLAAVADGPDSERAGDRALALLTGPIGRVDPVSLRQLRRALRRADGSQPPRDFGELLAQELHGRELKGGELKGGELKGRGSRLPAGLAAPLRRVRAVLAVAGRSGTAGARDPRYTLWEAWHRSGLQRRWVSASDRGGPAGAQADRDLDAVTALFDITDQYVSRTAGASLRGLLDHLGTLQLPTVVREPLTTPDAVAVLSAHAALGREWDFVVVAGLQEGLWPNTVPRGGVLGTQRLVDLLDGVTAAVGVDARGQGAGRVSTRAPLLAEERRLLVAALGRARNRVLVTAVDNEGSDEAAVASPFFEELAQLCLVNNPDATNADDTEAAAPARAPRVLAPAPLVGRLRAAVCAPDGVVDDEVRRCAAKQLARLGDAGVPGADPAQWYGMTPVSTDKPLWSGDGQVVTLSPSTLQTLNDCPLRWLLERHGGADGRDVRSALGSVVHALVADPAKTEDQLLHELEKVWGDVPFDSAWYSRNELQRHRAMLSAFMQWRALTRSQLTEAGTEVDVDGVVGAADASATGADPAGPAGPGVRVRGRVDRVERDAAGRLVVVDIKTGKSPVSKDDAQRHAQLAMYQLAVAEGLLPHGDQPGGGRLVYLGTPGTGGAAEREQNALTPDAREEWRGLVRRAAAATQGPQFPARINDSCGHCPVRQSCPAQAGINGSAPE
jgi:superfamily I DNA/RNA helicase/RecB family exonuclease